MSCNGGTNGTASVSVSGGTGPYSYSWSSSGGTAATAAGLSSGTYTVTITDDNGCMIVEDMTITEPALITGTDIQSICAGESYAFNGVEYTSDNTSATDTFVAANGCDSIVTLNLTVSSHTIAGSSTSTTHTQNNGTVSYTNNSCEMVATINSGANNLGDVTSQVVVGAVIDPSGDAYISRYYNIETSLPGGAEVTLYFTQQEINDYNALVGIANPQFPQIGANGENLQITAFHSESGSGNGPGGFDTSGALKEVIPCTAFWNAIESRWEITFTTTQFSGFFAHTSSNGTPLPVKLSNITATNTGDHNLIRWNTRIEAGMDYFEIERSRDALNFDFLGSIQATGSNSDYRFIDEDPYSGVNYYRLKIMYSNGKHGYSPVVNAIMKSGSFNLIAFPNPTTDKLTLRIEGSVSGNAHITVSDLSGRTLFNTAVDNRPVMEISMHDMAQGIYFLKYQDDMTSQVIKIEKQ